MDNETTIRRQVPDLTDVEGVAEFVKSTLDEEIAAARERHPAKVCACGSTDFSEWNEQLGIICRDCGKTIVSGEKAYFYTDAEVQSIINDENYDARTA